MLSLSLAVAALVPLPCHQPAFTSSTSARPHSAPLLLANAPAKYQLPPPLAPVAPIASFYALHAALRHTLPRLGVTFPATIVGMLGGFAILCTLPRKMAQRLDEFFDPACRLMRDWLAAIFAPAFIALPLAMPPISASDLVTFLLLCAVGLCVTIATNAAIALSLAPRRPIDFEQRDLGTPDAGPPQTPPTPFPAVQQAWLVGSALVGALVHLLLRDKFSLCLCLLGTTLGSFSLATTRCSPCARPSHQPAHAYYEHDMNMS